MKVSRLDGQQFDVVVCGGGSAGSAAAWGSALAGARTALVERLGFCGGTPVTAGIHTLDAVHSCRDSSLPVVGGFAAALIDQLRLMGGLATADNPEEALSIHPEFLKVAIDRLLANTGVQVLFHASVVDVLMGGNRLHGVEVALLDGRARLQSAVTVDGTGDAAVAYFAGASCNIDPELQAITYHFRLGDVAPGYTWKELEEACRSAMAEPLNQGEECRFGGPWVIRLADGEVSINATRVFGNPVDPQERSVVERRAREDMLRIWVMLRDRVGALRSSYIISGATDVHIRESRKIVGDYVLTEDDILLRRSFPDAVALGAWPVDIHPTNGSVGVHPHKESPPEPYEIPYRCLLPSGIEGLLVAGRPISTTHRAHGSTRVPGTSLATGHAAGVAAALAACSNVTPRFIDVGVLREKLIEQGAILALTAHSVQSTSRT